MSAAASGVLEGFRLKYVKWCSLTNNPLEPKLLAVDELLHVLPVGLRHKAGVAEAVGLQGFRANLVGNAGIRELVKVVELHGGGDSSQL